MRIQMVVGSLMALVAAAPLRGETPLGTAFTYQGQLKDGGAPLEGTADFQFTLWDAAGSGSPPTGGVQVGGMQAVNALPVTAGLFTVALNSGGEFGGNPFNGNARWIQVAVRSPAGIGAFTTLAPRQPMTATPHTLFALNASAATTATSATTATTATNATQLNGQPAAFYQNASNINSGTLTDLRLSGNIPRLNAANAFGNFTNSFGGNVGIGNANPASPLHVGGAYTTTVPGSIARFDGDVSANGTFASEQGTLLSRSAAGLGAASLVLDAEADTGGTSWFINSHANNSPFGSPGGSLTFDNGVAAMTLTSAGNVGIGTSSPARRLHVQNGSAGAIAPHSNTSTVLERGGNNYLQMYSPDANESGLLFGNTSLDIRAAILADANNSVQFRAGGNTTRMTLDAAGNVGIGTSSPASTLHVAGTSPANVIISPTTADSDSQVTLSENTSVTLGTIIRYNGLANQLEVHGLNSGVVGASLFNVNRSSGDVGIGTSSPDAKLDVNGNIQLTGEVRRPATGTANMLPLCYGHVLEDGTIVNGSGNFSVATSQGSTLHVISVPGEDFGVGAHAYTVLVQVMNNDDAYIPTTSTVGGNLAVIIRDPSDNGARQADFSFLVYKP